MGDCLPATDPHHVVMMFCSSSQYSDWNSKWFDIFCHQQNSSCINKTTLDLIHSFSARIQMSEDTVVSSQSSPEDYATVLPKLLSCSAQRS